MENIEAGESPLFEPVSIRENASQPGLFVLDPIPHAFRAQLIHILKRLVGSPVITGRLRGVKQSADLWSELSESVAETLGRLNLSANQHLDAYSLSNFISSPDLASSTELVDAIEVVVNKCRSWHNSNQAAESTVAKRLDRAILEINQRFRQHHLGYRIQSDLIIRVDSQYVHREITDRAFRLMEDEEFRGAIDEFQSAHRHYLDDERRQAIGSAHSAFESALKTICDRKNWNYDRERDGAKRLIDIVIREKKLLPQILQPSFKKLVEVLEYGLPQIANRQGRHGQGSIPELPEEYLVAYALHLTAANIVLLIEAFQTQLAAGDS